MSVYADFWAAVEARDWAALAATVVDDVTLTWPQTRERVAGRDALIAFMAGFPGDWHLVLDELHEDGTGAATRIDFTLDGATQAGLTFFTAGPDGRIAAMTEYWPDPYEPPAGREHLVERY